MLPKNYAMKGEPICYLKETHEYLYDDLSTRKADKAPCEYVFYEKVEDQIPNKENENCENERTTYTNIKQETETTVEKDTQTNSKQERYKNFFCYKIDTRKKFNFTEIIKSTYKQYKETKKSQTLLESIENNHFVCKYNNIMYPPIKTLPVKYLISSVYKNSLIICNNKFQFYKLELIKPGDPQKKVKSTFFSNYKKEEAYKVIQRIQGLNGNGDERIEEEFRLNFNKTDILFGEGLNKQAFKDKYMLINNTCEMTDKGKEKEIITLTLFNDPLVSKVSCTEINIKREIFPMKLEGVLNQLENEMNRLIKYKSQNFWITKSLESIKTTNLFINTGLGLYEAFVSTPIEILEKLFDEFCLKYKICKDGLKNFKDCKCEISLEKSFKKGIYGMTSYFDLSESFSLYFLKTFSEKSFEKFIPKNLKYNLLAFIHKTFCKEYINEMYREYVYSIITKLDPYSYQLFNYKLFIQKEIDESNLKKVRNDFLKVNLNVSKIYKSFILLNEGNYLMEEIRGYDKVLNKNFLVKKEFKIIKKHEGRLPKGFINLFYDVKVNLNAATPKNDNICDINVNSLTPRRENTRTPATEDDYTINKEAYLNILSYLNKVKTSKGFNLGILLDFFELKNVRFSIFNYTKREDSKSYEFCKCGNYKLKHTKCKNK